MPIFTWSAGTLELAFHWSETTPVSHVAMFAPTCDQTVDQPLVELSAFGHGRFPGGFRHVETVIGKALRYLRHEVVASGGREELRIVQRDAERALDVVSVFHSTGREGVRTWTEVTAIGTTPLVLDFVSSFASGSVLPDSGVSVDELDLLSGANDWVAEGRWSIRPLREIGLARIDRELQHHAPRSRYAQVDRGSWSTGEALPTAAVLARSGQYALGWQVEHNGPWLHEIGETRTGAYVLLAGPTDAEHHWSHALAPGETFRSVPVGVVAVRGGRDAVLAALTRHRRAIRAVREVDQTMPVVFNDYMNTLMGDPTTEKLLPLVQAAADVGVDTFCIDAGWYAEGHWWDTVGQWQPAASRFPGGLPEVIGAIRERGMTAGLWLEPEVVGVNSPLASQLPPDAFFSRQGVRVAEHGRHLLDLRSPAARAHVDEVVDRVVGEYGAQFIKMDYNTMPGPGTDRGGLAAGDGLLEHCRSLLDWIDDVQERHPDLLIESCASGAMRMDYAMLSRLHIQSTSDQQDPVRYAAIAAAAPASIVPEQAGNWAYPRHGMPRELFVLSLVNGVLGRMYLSGYLNEMTPEELGLVREALTLHREVLACVSRTIPFWPLGLPDWESEHVALGLRPDPAEVRGGAGVSYLSVWNRGGNAGALSLPVPHLRGRTVQVEVAFPAAEAATVANAWQIRWDEAAGTIELTVPGGEPGARVLRLSPANGRSGGRSPAV